MRRFAQPLGIELEKWERRTIETKKGVVRLLPVAERAKQLFGDRVARRLSRRGWNWRRAPERTRSRACSSRSDRTGRGPLFGSGRRGTVTIDDPDDRSVAGATTLDRVHTGMLLQAGGSTNALRALVQTEQERGPDFLRLANALSAL